MAGIGTIIDVAEALRAPSVAVIDERCTHRHHQASTCSRCVEACPTRAITVSAEGPRVDAVTCVDCGACASACPTGALEPLKPTDSALAEEIATKAKYFNRVTVACSRVSSPGSGVVVLPCLARLDVSMILHAFERGAASVSLCTGGCDACPSKSVASQLLSAVVEAERFLDAFRLPGHVDIGEGLERVEPGEAETVGLSRRGFLEALRRGSAGYASKAMSVLLPEPADKRACAAAGALGRSLPAHVPEKRRRLIATLRSLLSDRSASGEQRQLFSAPAIDRGLCNTCGICGLICPTGALSTHSGARDALRITCEASACVGCGLCAEMCAPRALTLAPVAAERVLKQEGGETLLERSEEEAKPLYVDAEDKMRKLLGVAIYRT